MDNEKLPAKLESANRLPYLRAEEWNAYLDFVRDDPFAPRDAILVLRILRHTGADVGEVLGYERAGGHKDGICPRDLRSDRQLPRIVLKRGKVSKSAERLVPYPREFMSELTALIADRMVQPAEEVFAGVDRGRLERAHSRASRAIGYPDLTLKDLRHLAAISWAEGGVRLERMKEWLGHSSIQQTLVYARFMPSDAADEPGAIEAARLAAVV